MPRAAAAPTVTMVAASPIEKHSTKAAQLARKHGVSEGTIYAWKAKFGGMSVSDAQRLRALEDENGKLKRLLADAMLDKAALNDLLSKKW
jgi:putative transposase